VLVSEKYRRTFFTLKMLLHTTHVATLEDLLELLPEVTANGANIMHGQRP
jgi:hypothetical protein